MLLCVSMVNPANPMNKLLTTEPQSAQRLHRDFGCHSKTPVKLCVLCVGGEKYYERKKLIL